MARVHVSQIDHLCNIYYSLKLVCEPPSLRKPIEQFIIFINEMTFIRFDLKIKQRDTAQEIEYRTLKTLKVDQA